jgi:hypothetical protein
MDRSDCFNVVAKLFVQIDPDGRLSESERGALSRTICRITECCDADEAMTHVFADMLWSISSITRVLSKDDDFMQHSVPDLASMMDFICYGAGTLRDHLNAQQKALE